MVDISRGQQVYGYAKQFFKFNLQTTKIEQGCPRQWIDQQIEVAAIQVFSTQD